MMVADSDVLIDFLEGRSPTANRIALELTGANSGPRWSRASNSSPGPRRRGS
jgi:hypothetical protein